MTKLQVCVLFAMRGIVSQKQKTNRVHTLIVHVRMCAHAGTYMYMINIQTPEKYKAKTYKLNPKATIFQRKIAASGGT